MADRIQLRGDTAANWASVNPILAQREPGLETDTGKFKHGDGYTPWNSLPYASGPAGPAGAPGIPEDDMQYTKRIDWISDSQFYKGEAQPGTSESAASWRIKRITIGADDDVTEVYAGGTAEFDKVWANRASLTYV